jgi:hypothetical protein
MDSLTILGDPVSVDIVHEKVGDGMDTEAPAFPLTCFDQDNYLYILRTQESAAHWFEPLTVDEMNAVFDSEGRKGRFCLLAEGMLSWFFRVTTVPTL